MRTEPAYLKTPIIDPDGNPAMNVEIGIRPIPGGIALNVMGIIVAFGRGDIISFLKIIDGGFDALKNNNNATQSGSDNQGAPVAQPEPTQAPQGTGDDKLREVSAQKET